MKMSLLHFTEDDLINQIREKGNATVEEANLAARLGYLRALQWFSLFNPPVLPDAQGALLVAAYGHWKVLQWMISKNIPASAEWANLAAQNGQFDTVVWLAQQRIFPDIRGLNETAKNGHLSVLQYAARLSLFPDIQGFNLARQYCRLAGQIRDRKVILIPSELKQKMEPVQARFFQITPDSKFNLYQYENCQPDWGGDPSEALKCQITNSSDLFTRLRFSCMGFEKFIETEYPSLSPEQKKVHCDKFFERIPSYYELLRRGCDFLQRILLRAYLRLDQ